MEKSRKNIFYQHGHIQSTSRPWIFCLPNHENDWHMGASLVEIHHEGSGTHDGWKEAERHDSALGKEG